MLPLSQFRHEHHNFHDLFVEMLGIPFISSVPLCPDSTLGFSLQLRRGALETLGPKRTTLEQGTGKKNWERSCSSISWVVPLPRMPVTTRIIIFLVGDPYKPSFATVTGRGDNPINIHFWNFCLKMISRKTCLKDFDKVFFVGLLLGPVQNGGKTFQQRFLGSLRLLTCKEKPCEGN